ncbi:hypothetical protein VRB37_10265 [Erwinia billingiae]|uniref:hypothetical protein n=1 Tax=Erwinia billingiae TaxID=182337 RepID=UPI0030D36003
MPATSLTSATAAPLQVIGPNNIKINQQQIALVDAQMAAQDRADHQAAAKAQLNSTRAPGVSTSATLGYHVDHVAQNVSKTVAQQEGESRTLGNIDRSAQQATALDNARGAAMQHANQMRTESQAVAKADAQMAAQDRADRQAAAKAQLNSTRAPGVSTSATLGYHVDHVAQNVSKTVAQHEGDSRAAENAGRTAQQATALNNARGAALQHANQMRTESQAVAKADAQMAAQDRADRQAASEAPARTAANVARTEQQVTALQQATATHSPGLAPSGQPVSHIAQNVTETVAQQLGDEKMAANVARTAQQIQALAAAEGQARISANQMRTSMQVTALSAAKVASAEQINVSVTSVQPNTPVSVTINGVTTNTTAAEVAAVDPVAQVAIAYVPAFTRTIGTANGKSTRSHHGEPKGHTGRGAENAQNSAHNSPNGRAHGL